mmetsp:Transcript_5625/g.10195  ORF Transcript_5625/g.10195 Transcript_5625/m.10195 type:complete len:271 (+) Transcript_5625:109-921(+)
MGDGGVAAGADAEVPFRRETSSLTISSKWGRSSGLSLQHLSISCLNAGSMDPLTFGLCPSYATFPTICPSIRPSQGRSRVKHSQMMMAKAYTSALRLRASYPFLRTSGAHHAYVPTADPEPLLFMDMDDDRLLLWLPPKSATFPFPNWSTRMFRLFRSLWVIIFPWRNFIPYATLSSMFTAADWSKVSSPARALFSFLLRSPPEQYSMRIMSSVGRVMTPIIETMCWERSSLMTATSLLNCFFVASTVLLGMSFSDTIFAATVLPSNSAK